MSAPAPISPHLAGLIDDLNAAAQAALAEAHRDLAADPGVAGDLRAELEAVVLHAVFARKLALARPRSA
jgi:hypothetical protein